SGAMYRAFALKAIRAHIATGDAAALEALAHQNDVRHEPGETGNRVLLDGVDVTVQLRSPGVTAAASEVSVHPAIRRWLVGLQQALGAQGNVVMEGRDIGTAVFPLAEVKIYLTASTRERTRRRWQELSAQGIDVDVEQLEQEILARDLADSQREVAPLRPAEDAVIVHSDDTSADGVVEKILEIIDLRRQALVTSRG
ncbi:MAG: Cytidylate kinase, partial [Cyanobacteria bacterium RYN_339]|nr:Cytidylate kinase [Cyanobacteria bacterium RYN_339]